MNGRLVLGTAQLGMDYGISNTTGKPTLTQAEAMIAEAYGAGIRFFDTAQGYGDSEIILGKVLAAQGISQKVHLISKFDPVLDYHDATALEKALQKSLEHLQVGQIYGLMLHREEMLDHWQKGLGDCLKGFVAKGLVKHIGASVYTPEKALQALRVEGIDFVQIPSSIVDRRFEGAGVFKLAKEKGKTIFVRSIFLQGLLLMAEKDIPSRLAFAKETVLQVQHLAKQFSMDVESLCLRYALTKWQDAYIIFGAQTEAQVERNVGFVESTLPIEVMDAVEKTFNSVDEQVLKVQEWPR